MSTVALINRGRRPFVATLLHAEYCERGGTCGCRPEQFRRSDFDEQGRPRAVVDRRIQPASFSLLSGQRCGGFHPVIERQAGVAQALAAGELELVVEDPPALAAPTVVSSGAADLASGTAGGEVTDEVEPKPRSRARTR